MSWGTIRRPTHSASGQFGTNWNKLSFKEAKKYDVRAGPQKRRSTASPIWARFSRIPNKYKNFSQTGHSVAWVEIIDHLAEAVGEAIGGNFKPTMKLGAGLAAGAMFGKALARPASAAAIARWTRAAQSYGASPSIKNRVGINLATKSLIDNLRDFAPKTGQALSPQAASPDSNNPPSQGNAPRLQVRIP